MKKFLVFSLILALSILGWNAFRSPPADDDYSKYVRLSISFKSPPASGKYLFAITLRSNVRQPLRVAVNDKIFSGAIWVSKPRGEREDLYDRRWLILSRFALIDDPIVVLNPNSEIVWLVPIEDLRDINDGAIDVRDLYGSSIRAKLDRLAVVARGYRSNSAAQITPPIKMPPQ